MHNLPNTNVKVTWPGLTFVDVVPLVRLGHDHGVDLVVQVLEVAI